MRENSENYEFQTIGAAFAPVVWRNQAQAYRLGRNHINHTILKGQENEKRSNYHNPFGNGLVI